MTAPTFVTFEEINGEARMQEHPALKRTDAEKLADVTPVNYAFSPTPRYDVARLGVKGDGTNDHDAIQACFNMLLATGGTLDFDSTKTYRVEEPLTFLSDTTTPFPIVINFNNCLLDFTALSGSQVAITYGATSLANSHAVQSVTVGSVRLIGPDENGYPVAYGDRTTTTTGVLLQYCLHWTIFPHQIQAFYKGMRTYWSWSTLHLNHHLRNNHIGLHCDELSTFATWVGCNFLQNSVGVLMRGADTIACQNIISCRLETNDIHVHADADPGSAGGDDSIRDCVFRDCYYEDAEYDWFRIGMDYDETADPATRQATNSAGEVTNFKVIGGYWANNTLTPGSGTAALCFDKDNLRNTNVRGFQFDGPISLKQRCRGRPSRFSWRTTRNQTHETDELVSFEIGDGSVDFTMTSTTVTVGTVDGNIESITHVSNGVVDVNFHDSYASVSAYSVSGSADDRIITKDTANSTTGKVRVVMRDYAGAAAFSGNVSISIKGRVAG